MPTTRTYAHTIDTGTIDTAYTCMELHSVCDVGMPVIFIILLMKAHALICDYASDYK